MMVSFKGGKWVIEAFDIHFEKRWNLKKFGLDGWMNNEYHYCALRNSYTITMSVRIAEVMAEFLPEEMDMQANKYPPTPHHPDIHKLELVDDLSEEDKKRSLRLQMLLMYVVNQIYYHVQYPIYYAARFSSKRSRLYFDVLLYALRHLYGTRHIGLTLGRWWCGCGAVGGVWSHAAQRCG